MKVILYFATVSFSPEIATVVESLETSSRGPGLPGPVAMPGKELDALKPVINSEWVATAEMPKKTIKEPSQNWPLLCGLNHINPIKSPLSHH